jgi:putative ABC transport system ATP-binding protein
MNNRGPCLELRDVSYAYHGAKAPVLRTVNATFQRGKVYTIIGESGAGKSTLLALIAGLDTCTTGAILYNGRNLAEVDRDDYRGQSIGVIFQSYNLLLSSTALYNITLAMNIAGSARPHRRARRDRAYAVLDQVGIDRTTAERTILKLSGGEQQRVGIARALSHDPDVIIADEPTGNLDADTEEAILAIFARLAHQENRCVIIVTHSDNVTDIADEVIGLTAGRLVPGTTCHPASQERHGHR